MRFGILHILFINFEIVLIKNILFLWTAYSTILLNIIWSYLIFILLIYRNILHLDIKLLITTQYVTLDTIWLPLYVS